MSDPEEKSAQALGGNQPGETTDANPSGSAAPEQERTQIEKTHPTPLIVGVGASAGGLEAFSELLRNLPANTGMAFVLVQHLDPHHESILADLLANYTRMPVSQLKGDVPVEANHVYVIPPNATMVVADSVLRVSRPARELSYQRRPIDDFFGSLAENMGNRSIGVVLSGAASDGTLGLKAIKAEGGITFAQDATAKFDSMPRSAIAAGYVDFVLPPKRIAQELAGIARHPLTSPVPENVLGDLPTIDRILAALRKRTGVDFAQYKQATIQRRLARRMVLQKVETLENYLELLKHDPTEIDSLFDDLLIKVTEFFRDPAVFEALKDKTFPKLIAGRPHREPVRVWVPGCSTGEEVYSIAISFAEFIEAEDLSLSIQIFGTDASDSVIDRARAGFYDASISSSVSVERLRRFFTHTESGFQIKRNIRDLCVFSRHNLGADPPLSHMDLISCRNLLIYFAPALQHKVIDTLAYALVPGGCLLVGTSENTSRLSELFDPLDEEHRIYIRKASVGVPALNLITNITARTELEFPRAAPPKGPATEGPVIHAAVDHMLLSRYGPSGLVVDNDFRIVELRGDAGPYLKTPGGKGQDLLHSVREDLATHLRSAVRDAHQRNSTVRLDEIQVQEDRGFHFVRITVVPVALPAGDRYSVILFEDLADATERAVKRIAPPPAGEAPHFENPALQIEHLERELASNREYLQSIIEELRSTNEEAQSANEELQSSNEELQTTKEELQASNEELATINAEMHNRNIQLGQLNDDLMNLLGSINAPVVMVGNDLRVRRFTPAAEKVLRLIPSDIGRPISDIKPRVDVPNLDDILRDVIDTLKPREQDVQDSEGRGYLMSVRPYRTADNRIEGAVLVLTDITELRRGLEEIRQARDYAAAIVDTVREPLLVLDEKLEVRSANRAFYDFFRAEPRQVEGAGIYQVAAGQLNLPPVHELLDRLPGGESQLRDVEIEHDFVPVGRRTLVVNLRRIAGAGLILLAFEDITERKQASEARYRRLFESARDGIMILDEVSGEILDANPYTERLFGYARGELVGRKIWEIEPARDAAALRTAIQQIRDQGAAQSSDVSFRTKDGRAIQTEFLGNLYREGSRRAIQLNIRDLTERRKFERELQHTQKLESLGLLAGGVAHDFNNLLTGILGNASLVYSDLPAGDPSRVQLRSVMAAAEQAANLTRQLLAYAGKGRFITERIELSELIREVLPLIQTSLPKRVDVKLDLASELRPVEADPAQIQQLLMNLVLNGAEAVAEDQTGSVEIRTGKRELTAPEIREHFTSEALAPGAYVWLEVKDTGQGMDEGTKARIFDPFFTTKFTGRGLGLAAVSGIVRALRGAIRVYSTPGQGTTFYILFPATAQEKAGRRSEVVQAPKRGSGTILIVDDEKVVRQTAGAILRKMGYETLLAENGQEGVELFRKESGRIELVILDLTMPVMSGEEAYDLIRELRSDVPIVLASGYDQTEATARTPGRNFAGFIQKPFDVAQLSEAVAAALKPE